MSIALSDNTGWEELIDCRSKKRRGIGARRAEAADRHHQGARSGRDRRPQSVPVRSAVSGRAGEEEQRRNSTGAAAVDFCARGHRDSKSRKKQSITRSSQSMAAISSILFCSRNFTMSACVRLPVSNGSMSRGILIFAIAKRFPRLRARNCSAPTWTIRTISTARDCAASAKHARYRNC